MLYRKVLLAAASLLCATAFAAEKVTFYVPFSFEDHGQHFPASEYEVRLNDGHTQFILSSMDVPSMRLALAVHPDAAKVNTPELSIRFDHECNSRELRYIRLGGYETKPFR